MSKVSCSKLAVKARPPSPARHRTGRMRTAKAGRAYKSAGGSLLVLASRRHRHRQQSLKIRPRGPVGVAAFAPRAAPVARAKVMGGGREGPRALAGAAAGLAVFATLACNVASVVLFLRGYVDGRRLPRGCLARAGARAADGGALLEAAAEEEEEGEHAAFELAPDAVLNLELGDPMMYEAFWRDVGARAATVIRGSDAMSYFAADGAGALCWFLEPGFEREVRRIHRVVGNAEVDGYHVVVGTGATQLYQAAMYALSSPPRGDRPPVPVVSPAPYYSSYPPQTNLQLSNLYRFVGDARTFAGDECIELVCSPNNPDGAVREAVAAAGKAIHDLVYYWPQYTPITGRAAHDIMLFTMSKVTGHAGSRLGWALVKDREVARKMVYFVDRSTIGVSKESQLRATTILGVVSDAYESSPPPAGAGDSSSAHPPLPRLFDFARRRMEERWRTLRATVAASGTFSLPDETSAHCSFLKETVTACPAFTWLRCEKEGVEDCAEFLADHKIVARGGEQFGGEARCVRINMLDRDQVFDMLVHRLSAIN